MENNFFGDWTEIEKKCTTWSSTAMKKHNLSYSYREIYMVRSSLMEATWLTFSLPCPGYDFSLPMEEE
jgi:hypothetical protein